MTEAHTVVLAAPKGPLVKLDDKHYKLVDKMEALTEAPPSLIHADSLTVKGPVRFLQGTSFAGDVLITNGAPRSGTLLGCYSDARAAQLRPLLCPSAAVGDVVTVIVCVIFC